MKQFYRYIIYFLILIVNSAPVISSANPTSNNTNLIVYSYDRPMQLYAFLESVDHYVSGLDSIYVIYRTSNSEYQKAYETVQASFKKVTFLAQSAPYNDLKEITCKCLLESPQPYLLFGVDDIIIKDFIDLHECAAALEKHNGYGFFLRLGKNLDYCYAMGQVQPLPPLKNVGAFMYSWQFNQGIYDWNYPHNLDCTMYRLSDLIEIIFFADFSSPNSLESQLMRSVDYAKTGLCYESSKIVNFPLNMVQNECPNNCQNSYSTQDLLELFNKGLKIDLKPIDKIANKSAHSPSNNVIRFIPRETQEEKLIIIVTPSYNNKEWWEWNLTSLLNQNYSNYRIIITDDCSTDGTGDAIENYIKVNQLEHKITLIKNKERRGALHNLYTMIHSCPNDAIIATVDGDDALPDPEVLNRLNYIYSTQDVWLTYGQFIEYPSGNKGWCCPIPKHIIYNNTFREFSHLPSHLRTFYAWLFKHIKLEDLFDRRGNFYAMTCDYATMLPMIEMAGERHLCIQEQIMYIYNTNNTICDHKISRQLQAYTAQVICNKTRYSRLLKKDTDFLKELEKEKVDIIIFADDLSPYNVERLLISIKQNVTGIGQIYVLYLLWPTTIEHYTELKKNYPIVNFLEIDENRTNFKDLLNNLYHKQITNNYVLFALPNNIIEHPINLVECLKMLEETQAYAFSLKLSKENSCYTIPKNMSLVEINNDICAWNYACATDVWACANNVDLVLYRRNTQSISTTIQNYCMYSWIHFVGWWSQEGNLDKIGLCFKNPKTKNCL